MIIKFDKNIYSFKAVAAAARAFSALADFKIKAIGKAVVVEIKGADMPANEDKIRDEFSNYVLFLMNK